jgi:hypothetical protein
LVVNSVDAMYMKKSLTTSTVTKVLKKNLKALPRKHSIPSLRKRVTLGTSNVIEKVLQFETGDQS